MAFLVKEGNKLLPKEGTNFHLWKDISNYGFSFQRARQMSSCNGGTGRDGSNAGLLQPWRDLASSPNTGYNHIFHLAMAMAMAMAMAVAIVAMVETPPWSCKTPLKKPLTTMVP